MVRDGEEERDDFLATDRQPTDRPSSLQLPIPHAMHEDPVCSPAPTNAKLKFHACVQGFTTLSPSGGVQWTRALASPSRDLPMSLSISEDGRRLWVTGSAGGVIPPDNVDQPLAEGTEDADALFVALLDIATGRDSSWPPRRHLLSSAGDSRGVALTIGNGGDAVVAGWLTGSPMPTTTSAPFGLGNISLHEETGEMRLQMDGGSDPTRWPRPGEVRVGEFQDVRVACDATGIPAASFSLDAPRPVAETQGSVRQPTGAEPPTGEHGYAARIDVTDGAIVWFRVLGSAGIGASTSVAKMPDIDVVVVGGYSDAAPDGCCGDGCHGMRCDAHACDPDAISRWPTHAPPPHAKLNRIAAQWALRGTLAALDFSDGRTRWVRTIGSMSESELGASGAAELGSTRISALDVHGDALYILGHASNTGDALLFAISEKGRVRCPAAASRGGSARCAVAHKHS